METKENNVLFFGNPYEQTIKTIKKINNQYQEISNYFKNEEFIFPDEEKTLSETSYLLDIQNKRNGNIPVDFKKIDTDLYNFMHNIAVSELKINSEDSNDILSYINKNINPLVLDIKNYWNRARPFQYAYLFQVPLHPYETKTGARTPSYPSGHSLQAYIYTEYLAELYPEKAKQLIDLRKLVDMSRVDLGIHFVSDVDFSHKIAEYLFAMNLVMKQS